MKKIYLILFSCVYMLAAKTQVSSYTFSQSSGTYTPLTGGTVVGQATNASPGGSPESATMDDHTYTGISIPFSFTFNGVAYNSLNANTNGWISFGATSTSTSTPISGTETFSGVVSAFANDMMGIFATTATRTSGSPVLTAVANTSKCVVGAAIQGTGIPAGATILSFDATSITISANASASGTATYISWTTGEIRTETLGTAPNRTFVVQFKGLSEYGTTAGTTNNTSADFQIRLNEGGGNAITQSVEIVYGQVFRAAGSETIQVGLRGSTNAEYNNRTSASDWSATTAGASNSANVAWGAAINPTSGLSFMWTPNATAVDYCNIQFPGTATIPFGGNVTVYTQGYEPGVTEPQGQQGPGITVWIAVNSTDTDPSSWPSSAWTTATYNAAGPANNNDEYMLTIGSTLAPGTYYYASRWQLSGGQYKYGAYSPGGGGFWDGTNNINGVLTVSPPPPPANDNCGNAVSLTPSANTTCVTQTAGTTLSATQSTDAAPSCGATGINDDVWYSFVASSTAHTVTLSNVSGSTDMAMALYSGSCGSLTQIVCSDPNAMTSGGLTVGQTYYVRVWTFVATPSVSATFNICVTSPPPPPANDNICNATVLSVSPGVTCTTSLTGQSTQYATQSLPACTGTADEDVWYSFVATNATHYVTITSSGSGSTDRVHQVYSSSDNTCSGTLTSITCSDPETSTSSGLTPGNTYFVRVHSYGSTNYATFDICITSPAPPPANDAASGAITLTVGSGCSAAPYTNVGGTQAANEKFASCFQSATTGTGNTIATHTVWYKFVATGTAVKVTTDITGGTLNDTHLGLFSATDASDYNTFNIISCDDDNGSTGTLRSTLYATGLTIGQTYYVSVDGYNGGTGTFCLTVDNLTAAMLSATNICSSTYQTPSGVQTSYAGQVPIVDATGNLVAIVRNPAGGSVSLYTAAQNINTGGIRQSTETGIYYLDRNFRIVNTTATNVEVQFFFLASELAALNTADGTTLGNLAVTRQLELVSGCQANFSSANGATIVLPQTANGTSSDGTINWIQVTTPGFSNFYLNKIGTTLPVTIEYFRGTKQNNRNVLDWKVSCYNSPSVTLILERSSDGRQFKDINTSIETAARCLQPFNYNDLSPLAGINYYRLKSIDVDRKISYSNVVALLNKDKGFEIVSLAPNPVKDEAILSVTSAERSIMEVVVSDLNGKQVSKQRVSLIAGNNQLPLNLRNVAAGTYQVTGLTADGLSRTLRFVKQ